jgi:nucleoside-diphosphate-sugar epimerase
VLDAVIKGDTVREVLQYVDFDTNALVNKLRKDPTRLEILGSPPGTLKSYVHVSDVVAGIMSAWKAKTDQVDFFNIGSEDVISVKELAEIIVKEMDLGTSSTAGLAGWMEGEAGRATSRR